MRQTALLALEINAVISGQTVAGSAFRIWRVLRDNLKALLIPAYRKAFGSCSTAHCAKSSSDKALIDCVCEKGVIRGTGWTPSVASPAAMRQ